MLQNLTAELFKTLGHPVRIRILEFLCGGELTVSELQTRLDIDNSTVSQQLAALRARGLVVGRKDGTSVYYRIVDPLVFQILDTARAIFERHVNSLQAMVDDANDAAQELLAVPGRLEH